MIEINQNDLLRNLSEKAFTLSQKYSWEKHAKEILLLYSKFTKPKQNWNFDNSYDIAVYRTLTTIIELFVEEHKGVLMQSLLNFDYSKIISWSIKYGLFMPQCKDFLLPFKDWLLSKTVVGN